jgi:TPR repeat protein
MPKTDHKMVWEKKLSEHRNRLGILPPAKKTASKPKNASTAPEGSSAAPNKKHTLYTLKDEVENFLKLGYVDEAREFFTSESPLVGGKDDEDLTILSARIYVAAKKYDEAIMEYKKIAGKLTLNIYYEIAEVYALDGNYSKSLLWYKKGVEVPNVHNKRANCEKLAEAYKLGRGVEKNDEKYLYWLREAATRSTKKGEGKPYIELADYHIDNSDTFEAVKCIKSAAKLCDIDGIAAMSEIQETLNSNKEKRQKIA